MTENKYCVGVDIASSTFTVAVGAMPWQVILKPQTFENTEDGYQTLVAWFAEHHLAVSETVVCMEATGVYSEGLAYFLYAKGYRVAVQSPLEVKRTFKPYGPKSDAVDSLQIAEYACRHTDKLSFWKPRSEILEQVKALLAVREQFVSQNTAHKNALKAIQRKVVRTLFAEQAYLQLIEQVKKQIKAIDTEVRRLIESDPTFKEMLLLLISIPGVQLLLAAHFILLAQFSLEYKVLASFLGIAPNEHSSGTSVFKHATSRHFGPSAMRKLLDIIGNNLCKERKQGNGRSNRMPAIHSQVVQRAGYFHRQIRKAFFGISENIFDNPTTFDTRNRVFYKYPRAGNQSIQPLIRGTQFFALWLFFG